MRFISVRPVFWSLFHKSQLELDQSKIRVWSVLIRTWWWVKFASTSLWTVMNDIVKKYLAFFSELILKRILKLHPNYGIDLSCLTPLMHKNQIMKFCGCKFPVILHLSYLSRQRTYKFTLAENVICWRRFHKYIFFCSSASFCSWIWKRNSENCHDI